MLFCFLLVLHVHAIYIMHVRSFYVHGLVCIDLSYTLFRSYYLMRFSRLRILSLRKLFLLWNVRNVMHELSIFIYLYFKFFVCLHGD